MMEGFTLVWSGSNFSFSLAIKIWAYVPQENVKAISLDPDTMSILVANECINWPYYRAFGEYIPVEPKPKTRDKRSQKKVPETNTQDLCEQLDYFGKL